MKPVAYISHANLADLTREGSTIVGVTVYRTGYQPYTAGVGLYVLTQEQVDQLRKLEVPQ